MKLVACPRCGAQFDVSSFAPGSAFVCGACQNTLQVPGAAAPAPAAPARAPAKAEAKAPAAAPAPAAPAAIAKKPAMDRRRAGDASGEQKREGRAERLRRQRESEGGEGAKKRNPLPLVLAGLAGVAILGGAGYLMMGGKDDAKKGEVAPATGGPGVADGAAKKAPAPTPPAEKTFEQQGAAERLAEVEKRKKEGTRTAALVKETHAWLLSKGLKEDAAALLAAGRAEYPEDPWILETLGLVNRGAELRRAADDEAMLMSVPEEDEDLVLVLSFAEAAKKDKTKGWIPKADAERLDKALESLKAKTAAMGDPVYVRTKREFDNVRLDASFQDLKFSFETFRPYVIFVEVPGDRKEAADRAVQATGKILSFLYARWLQFMKEDLKLDPPRLEDSDDARLKVFVFKSRESFDAWHLRNQVANPGESVAAYYDPNRTRMIMMHADSFEAGTIMHEGTHQMIHWYARHFTQLEDDAIAAKEGKKAEKVEFNEGRLSSRFFWFQEGIAEYFGGAVKDKENEGEWKIGALQRGRLGYYAFMKGQTPSKLWPVEDFLFRNQSEIYAAARVKTGWTAGDDLKGLMYSQGWGLVHYFLHGEDGRWREKFCTFMRNELCGKSGKVYLLQSFGLPTQSTDPKVQAFMKEIGAGYTKYMDGLLTGSKSGK